MIRFYPLFSFLFFVSIFISFVYTCNPGTFSLIFNILFFFSADFISHLTLFSHRNAFFFLFHEVNSSSSGSFIVFDFVRFYHIYVDNSDIFIFLFFFPLRHKNHCKFMELKKIDCYYYWLLLLSLLLLLLLLLLLFCHFIVFTQAILNGEIFLLGELQLAAKGQEDAFILHV